MSFKTKYVLRNYFIDFIEIFFSFSLLLLVYAKIEQMKFASYGKWVKENPTEKFMNELNISGDNYWNELIGSIGIEVGSYNI